MKPYIISSLDYTHKSQGVRVLHELCRLINKAGYEAYMNCKKTEKGVPTLWGEESKLRKMTIDGAIAVYPEINRRNYLWSKNPVGWLLNKGSFDFEKEGLIFTFSREHGEQELLTILIAEDYFKNDKQYKRKYNAVYVGKGREDNRTESITDKYIFSYLEPTERKKTAEILKRSKVLYTYDSRTALSSEAIMCGCPVILLENGDNTLKDHKESWYQFKGITNCISKLRVVKEEMDLFTKQWREKAAENEKEVKRFIDITQAWAAGRE